MSPPFSGVINIAYKLMSKIRAALNAIYKDKKELGLITQKTLAQRMNCSQSAISQYLSGESAMSAEVIEAFCAALGVKISDLEHWNPQLAEIRFSEPHARQKPKELRQYISKLERLHEIQSIPGFRNVTRSIDDWLQAADRLESVKESNIRYLDSDAPRPVALVRVRYYDAIPAGDPREMAPEGQMWIDIVHSKAKDTWYTLRVWGDSMEPEYREGDIVLMDYARQPKDGDIVAALIDGTESTLKVFSRKDDKITLTPINASNYNPKTYHASRVRIQGVLLELVRRVHIKKWK